MLTYAERECLPDPPNTTLLFLFPAAPATLEYTNTSLKRNNHLQIQRKKRDRRGNDISKA